MIRKKKSPPPLLGAPVMAGFPSPAEQYLEAPLDLNDLLVHQPAATFFVRAAGDSMLGAGIHPGDILVVDRSLAAEDGAVVIAAVDNEFTVKYYRHDSDGVRLEAANRRYKPLRFSPASEVLLFGVVTAVIHQFVRPAARRGQNHA
ncbi:MAG: translesion error-prone DNA polymerase V autoproteolytic subunit [Oligosphaeraceae bacterium]|jgi:DNA polymerase V|nr:translesion error-prone DNA polymerase V autoproteolytic subunit [Oligosphaeraceae bacterium]